MRRPLALLRITSIALALGVAIVAVSAMLVEQGGGLRRFVEGELGKHLGPLGDQVEILDARAHWFEPSIELEGLSIGAEVAHFERVRIVLERKGLFGVGLGRIEIDGGHILWSASLQAQLESQQAEDDPDVDDPTAPLPALQIRGVEWVMASEGGTRFPLGSVDLLAEPGAAPDAIRLQGSLLPVLGEDHSGTVHLRGRFDPRSGLRFEAWARDLSLSPERFPPELLPEAVRSLEPRARVDLRTQGQWHPEGLASSYADVRARVRSGLLRPPGTDMPVEDLSLDLQARYGPPLVGSGKPRWDGILEGGALWNETPIAVGGNLGRSAGDDHFLSTWLDAPSLALNAELGRMAQEIPGFSELWNGLDPGGDVGVLCGMRLRRRHGPHPPEIFAEVRGSGRTQVKYYGWPDIRTGEEQGFPLPVRQARGTVVVGFDARREHPFVVGLRNLRGEQDCDAPRSPARVGLEGIVRGLPEPVYGRRSEALIYIDVEGLEVHDEVGEAFQHLAAVSWLWDGLLPRAGTLDGVVNIRSDRHHPAGQAFIDARLRDTAIAWFEVPVPMQDIDGRVTVLRDGFERGAVSFRGSGRTRDSEAVRVAGRVQSLPLRGAPERDLLAPIATDIEIEMTGLELGGRDLETLGETSPDLADALEDFRPGGTLDARARISRPRPGVEGEGNYIVRPSGLSAHPARLPIPLADLRGMISIVQPQAPVPEDERQLPPTAPRREPPVLPATLRVGPVVGSLIGARRPTVEPLRGALDPAPWIVVERADDRDRLPSNLVSVAGLGADDVDWGALFDPLPGGDAGTEDGLPIEGLEIGGHLDLRARWTGDLDDGTWPEVEAQLRETSLAFEDEDFAIHDLRGGLEVEDGALRGPHLEARIARTPIELRNAGFEAKLDGSWSLRGQVWATDYPLDREHLSVVLDGETLDPLLEDLKLRGNVDVRGGDLLASGKPGTPPRVSFRGPLLLSGVYLQMGLPLHIRSASLMIREFIVEGESVRSWAQVQGMFGTIADRRLDDTNASFTYIAPHLNLLELDGLLEGGRIRGLRESEASTGSVFSVDLQPPFPFELGVELDRIPAEGLLRGLFESNVESRGDVSSSLRLVGSLERLDALAGNGTVSIERARLFGIPAVRELFNQLGFDATAVFDSVNAHFRVQDGALRTTALRAHSPLLQLVGEGTTDFDGSLDYTFQVRYSLVDKLPLLNRLLYFVQNNLLSIRLAGDMGRPRVELEGLLSILGRPASERPRDLPLPPLRPLPVRF